MPINHLLPYSQTYTTTLPNQQWSGDTLHFSTRAIFRQPHGSGWNTAQTVGNMLSSIITAFVGPGAPQFDGKANLLTNGQTIINTTAFNNAIQHQQQNTPANNTPRAFIKALFFNDQMQLTDSALMRINRGANTVHTYSGQRTAQQNGYVYIYVTNESSSDVWFDDLMVSHRTGPLLQEAHFYPFGQEITPLSSRALLKTPNERMLQQNEWDEEFGMNLHDFDARMYDASIGRFLGVDVYADNQFPLSPYHYAANNPIMMQDPDGRFFVLALGLVLKGVKLAKGIKIGISAAANMIANKKQIGAATKGEKGSFFRGLGMALGYGAAGAIGGAVGVNYGGGWGFLAGGISNVGFEWSVGQFSKDGINVAGRAAGSFLTGGFSALAGKNFGEAFAKGGGFAAKKAGIKVPEVVGDLKFNVAEPLLQNGVASAFLNKINAKKQIFSPFAFGQYSLKGLENIGTKLNSNNGKMNLGEALGYFGAGFAGGVVSNSISKGLTNLDGAENLLGLKTVAAPLLGYGVGDFIQNSLNYMTKKEKITFNWKDVYNDGLKSIYKVDFFSGASLMGFTRFNRIF